MWKKALKRGLILALIIAVIGLIGGAPDLVLSFFVPPRIYFTMSVIIALILISIYIELVNRNRRQDSDDNAPVSSDSSADDHPRGQFYMENDVWKANPDFKPDASPVQSEGYQPGTIYSEPVSKFLARNDDAKLIKLTGSADDLASYDVGNRCHVEYNYDSEKYSVTCGGFVIGFLPSSAITYAEKHETDPDGLDVIVADVDYDIEKERDIISVYIA